MKPKRPDADKKAACRLWAAIWLDGKDCRIAGIYQSERSAQHRIEQLGAGFIQRLTMNREVRFTHEEKP